jgi:hypothetical protein
MRDQLCIISGGQTGVDRGALDAALALGVRCGGWCPADRRDENGLIPAKYPLMPLPQGGYLARTRRNVADSDGTLIIHFGPPTGGTAATIRHVQKLSKPMLCIDASTREIPDAISVALAFLRSAQIRVLNVAGPRESQEARGHDYAQALLSGLLQQ